MNLLASGFIMMNGRERPRLPGESHIPGEFRRPVDGRGDGRGNDPAGARGAQVSRAEKFEDEKRRIMQSCFARKDGNNVGA